MLKKDTISVKIGTHELIFEAGHIARQANGAVLVRCGETVVFSSACAAPTASPDIDFLPLRVDYQEFQSSTGKTPNGYIKRQGRLSEKEILGSRLIDRPLRPLFENGYFNEVQLLSYVWSYDGVNSAEPLAICAASAALVISDIPLVKPVGGVRVGMAGTQFIINPTQEQMKTSKLDLMIAGTEDAVLMIEGFCDFLTEDEVLEAIQTGHDAIKKICATLLEWQKRIGKEKNRSSLRQKSEDLTNQVCQIATPLLKEAMKIKEKKLREEALAKVNEAVYSALLPEGQETTHSKVSVDFTLKHVSSNAMRKMILEEKIRSDGRKTTEIRPIYIEQGLLPRVHGSSLFTRGETQAVVVCTLGGESMGQRYEDLDGEGLNRFYLHYFFPPFSVGEVGRVGAPGRREVGHGKLAERALKAILPKKEKFPYAIRLESNITESNGSSSMASVCGGCLALMDSGVPITRPVAGIAMGLILEEGQFVILSDILGVEDYLGDMDFKVTGDKDGITAFQMDIKVEGITIEIMRAALAQAKNGRIHILEKMLEICPKYKETMSEYAPRIETMTIKPSKIATVIGPGGKQIRAIIEETGVQIDIDDSGTISIAASDLPSIERAKEIIMGLTSDVEIGRVYQGTVVSIAAFGAFVEILPGKEGLCHNSEFDHSGQVNIGDFVKQGDKIPVKVLDINERGQIKLSRKAAIAK